MKSILISLLVLSFSAMAQDNVLSQSEMTLSNNSLILEKPANGPSFIILNVPVPTTQNVCVRYDERQTFGPNAEQCGYDLVERRDCHYVSPYPSRGGVIVRRGPVRRGGGPIRGGGVIVRRGPMPMPTTRCHVYTERVPRSCYFMETFCAESETQVNIVYKKFNLEFSKFSTEAKINFMLDENNNLTLDVVSMPANCIKKTTYGENGIVTGAKLKLKNRCR